MLTAQRGARSLAEVFARGTVPGLSREACLQRLLGVDDCPVGTGCERGGLLPRSAGGLPRAAGLLRGRGGATRFVVRRRCPGAWRRRRSRRARRGGAAPRVGGRIAG